MALLLGYLLQVSSVAKMGIELIRWYLYYASTIYRPVIVLFYVYK